MRAFRSDPLLLILVLVAALLLFGSLSGRSLWQDEAETALLAKSILASARPTVFDGRNLVSQEAGREFGPDLLWRWSPWLQYYVAAAAIALCGRTTFAARLPFALLGLLTVPLTWRLARRLFGSPAVTRLSALLLITSVPFLLHARQARWYSLIDLALVGLLLCAVEMRRHRWLPAAGFVVAGVVAFYSNYFVATGILAAILVAAPILDSRRPFLVRLVLAEAIVGLAAIPGILFFDPFGKEKASGVVKAAAQLWYDLCSYWTFALPLPVLALVLYLVVRRPNGDETAEWRRPAAFLVALSLAYLIFIAFGPWVMFRYVSVLVPPAAILIGVGAAWLLGRWRHVGVAAAIFLAATNVIHLAPLGYLGLPGTVPADNYPRGSRIGSPLLGYLHELIHPPRDPERVVAAYLDDHARPEDVVMATYGDLPLQFYTGLKIVGGLQGGPLPVDPDWILIRQFMMGPEQGKDSDVFQFIRSRIDPALYRMVRLEAKDFKLGNAPDPEFHLFREPEAGPPLLLLHRRSDRPGG
jgi:4-amino-4-deoxy-L-arabinose transferase-like glycosyltransferase